MKISKQQSNIILKMRNGWELGISEGFYTGAWIQEGGIGCGGESEKIRIDTAKSLIELGIIEESSRKYPTTKYKLTDKFK